MTALVAISCVDPARFLSFLVRRAKGRWIVAAAAVRRSSLPIVHSVGDDIARPFHVGREIDRGGLVHELIPQATVVAALANPSFPDTADRLRKLQEAAPTLGKQIQVVNAATASEIDAAFASFAQRRPDALIVVSDLS
jgi:hypothetical protein